MKLWILRNSFCVLFEIGWKHYAAVNFGARPFPRLIKRKKIKRNNILSSVYRYYTNDFPTDFLDFGWTGEVVYYHELYRLLFLTENENLVAI